MMKTRAAQEKSHVVMALCGFCVGFLLMFPVYLLEKSCGTYFRYNKAKWVENLDMASFDFIEASLRGYKAVWENRAGLISVAAMPFFIKMGCFAAVVFLGLETNFLRQGLVLLPSYFAEGVLVAYVIRMVMSGGVIGRDVREAEPFARDLTASMVIYVLTKLVMACLTGVAFTQMIESGAVQGGADGAAVEAVTQGAEGGGAEVAEPSMAMFFLSVMALAAGIWAFRLLWLYVPMAMGVRIGVFMRALGSFGSSFAMMGCWIMCFVPFGILMLIGYEVVAGALGHSAETPSQAFSLVLIPVQAAIEVVIALVSSLAMAYGIQQIFEETKN